MAEKKQVKTLSFRADPETLDLMMELKSEMQLLYGVSVSNSDVIRKALKEMSFQIKEDRENEDWKE